MGLKYNGQLSDGSANVGPQASDWGGVGLIHARTAKKISNQKHTHTEKQEKGAANFEEKVYNLPHVSLRVL